MDLAVSFGCEIRRKLIIPLIFLYGEVLMKLSNKNVPCETNVWKKSGF